MYMLRFGGTFRKIKVINEILNADAIIWHNDTLCVSTHIKHYCHEQRSVLDIFNFHHYKKVCR